MVDTRPGLGTNPTVGGASGVLPSAGWGGDDMGETGCAAGDETGDGPCAAGSETGDPA